MANASLKYLGDPKIEGYHTHIPGMPMFTEIGQTFELTDNWLENHGKAIGRAASAEFAEFLAVVHSRFPDIRPSFEVVKGAAKAPQPEPTAPHTKGEK